MSAAPAQDWRPIIRRLLAYIAPFRTKLTIGLVCGALSTLVLPQAMLLVKKFINTSGAYQGNREQAIQNVIPICFSVIGLYTVLMVLRFFQNLYLSEVTQRVGMSIRRQVYAHLQRMPLSFFHRQRTGGLMATLTNDVLRLQNAANLLKDSVTHPVQGVVYFIFMLLLSWRLTLFTIAAVPLMSLVIRFVTKKLRAITSQSQAKLADVTSVMEETLSSPRIVQAFSAEEREVERFDGENQEALRIALRGVRRTAVLSPAIDWIGSFAIALVLYAGTIEQVPPGDFIAFVGLANLLATTVGGLGNLRGQFEELLGAAERIFTQVLDVVPEIRDQENAIVLPPVRGELHFDGVTFGYDPERPVLREIELTIQPGEVVAFVGPTGAGKSTLADLVPRFYDPTVGTVRVDGHDLRTVTLRSLREQIGLVPQDTVLFSGTIRDNLAYGRPEATDAEIIAAAQAANAHAFILEKPEGYATRVGERGVTLSGGQRQRLAIARALLKNPRILIFDEATSALDAQTESLVQEALGTWFKGRTTIIIAHRLSTIVNADRIVVLKDGCIVEQGRHTELVAQRGVYAALYETQQRGIDA